MYHSLGIHNQKGSTVLASHWHGQGVKQGVKSLQDASWRLLSSAREVALHDHALRCTSTYLMKVDKRRCTNLPLGEEMVSHLLAWLIVEEGSSPKHTHPFVYTLTYRPLSSICL
jgi:hypothetical protein